MTNPQPLLIDTDPGVDDALALLMAFAHPRVALKALTIAAGNVGLDHTVANALRLVELAGLDVPVHAGCATPLLHPAADAAYVHGLDGFGDAGLPPPRGAVHPEHAALAILRHSHDHAGELLLVTLGPLTNLALALRLDPTLPTRVKRLVVMGGAVTGQGNTSIPAEFNIAFDPEAAHVVFDGFPLAEVVDWELVLRHGMDFEAFEGWLAAGDARAAFYAAISAKTRAWGRTRGHPRFLCADALAMAHVLEPEGAGEVLRRPLVVELEGRHARGQTLVDWQQRSGRPANADVVMAYDQARFERLVRGALGAG